VQGWETGVREGLKGHAMEPSRLHVEVGREIREIIKLMTVLRGEVQFIDDSKRISQLLHLSYLPVKRRNFHKR
jgi:hypothetical protein